MGGAHPTERPLGFHLATGPESARISYRAEYVPLAYNFEPRGRRHPSRFLSFLESDSGLHWLAILSCLRGLMRPGPLSAQPLAAQINSINFLEPDDVVVVRADVAKW